VPLVLALVLGSIRHVLSNWLPFEHLWPIILGNLLFTK